MPVVSKGSKMKMAGPASPKPPKTAPVTVKPMGRIGNLGEFAHPPKTKKK